MEREERERERERESVCVCVCVRERERDSLDECQRRQILRSVFLPPSPSPPHLAASPTLYRPMCVPWILVRNFIILKIICNRKLLPESGCDGPEGYLRAEFVRAAAYAAGNGGKTDRF